MIEIPVNFDEVKLAQVGILSVSIDDVKLDCVYDAEKKLHTSTHEIIIKNSLPTSIRPQGQLISEIHIVSEYLNIDTKEKVIVHERTFGKITDVSTELNNNSVPSPYEIVIKEVSDIEYTMEVKTKEEELEDEVECLKNRLNKLETKLSEHLKKELERELEEAFSKQLEQLNK